MKEIILRSSNKVILVDDEDYAFLNKFIWKVIKKGVSYDHAYSTHYGKIVRPHRLILNLTDPKVIVDHINGNTLDNRRVNLRICSFKENSRNIPKRKGNCSSKYKGVTWNKAKKAWSARITTDFGRIHLGYFSEETAAANAYNSAAKEHHKEFANFTEIFNG